MQELNSRRNKSKYDKRTLMDALTTWPFRRQIILRLITDLESYCDNGWNNIFSYEYNSVFLARQSYCIFEVINGSASCKKFWGKENFQGFYKVKSSLLE